MKLQESFKTLVSSNHCLRTALDWTTNRIVDESWEKAIDLQNLLQAGPQACYVYKGDSLNCVKSVQMFMLGKINSTPTIELPIWSLVTGDNNQSEKALKSVRAR